MSDIFFVRLGRRGNLFANLSRVVIEGSRGLSKRKARWGFLDWFKELAWELFCEARNVSTR